MRTDLRKGKRRDVYLVWGERGINLGFFLLKSQRPGAGTSQTRRGCWQLAPRFARFLFWAQKGPQNSGRKKAGSSRMCVLPANKGLVDVDWVVPRSHVFPLFAHGFPNVFGADACMGPWVFGTFATH